MSQTSHLKSTSITNLDATPYVQNTSGEGAQGFLRVVNDYATPLAADATGSTYQILRVRSNVKLKHLYFESQAQGAGAIEVGLSYSDSTIDGTAPANQGAVINASLFATEFSIASAVTQEDLLTMAGTAAWTSTLANEPLWQAAGLSSDPGGCFDIVCTVNTSAITTGTGQIKLEAQFVI